jgi:hypothetical protein
MGIFSEGMGHGRAYVCNRQEGPQCADYRGKVCTGTMLPRKEAITVRPDRCAISLELYGVLVVMV